MSTHRDPYEAIREIAREISPIGPDLAVVFTSHAPDADFSDWVRALRRGLRSRALIGCTAESVIGPDREVEETPAVAAWGARLPGAALHPFPLLPETLAEPADVAEWKRRLGGADPEDHPSFLVLADPYTADVGTFLAQADSAFPGSVFAGGMASGGAQGAHRLFLDDESFTEGFVGMAISGVKVRPLVSQGCRPVGKPFVVTRARDNLIEELGGRPAFDVLQEVFSSAPPEDRTRMQRGLHMGRVIDETLREHRQGDFLVRNIIGAVDNRVLVINDAIRPGRTVQFHVRDARTADEELQSLLAAAVSGAVRPPGGALMFSCNGRGTRMFDAPHHDVGVVNRLAPGCQVAGFFANGEIGPVGRKTFLHGFTCSLLLFEE